MADIITYNIPIDKYALLKKINPDYINVVIQDIFENGYNAYVRSLMNGVGIGTGLGVGIGSGLGLGEGVGVIGSGSINAITEQKVSSVKGQIGENVVYDILVEKFPDYTIENTSKVGHSGDIQMLLPNHNKVIIEVKNYNKTIDTAELDKLKYDMKFNKCNYAIFVSLNSGIVGKKRFQLETFHYDRENYYILYVPYAFLKGIPNKKSVIVHNSVDDSLNNLTIKLEFCICIISNLSTVLKDNNHNYNRHIEHIINEIDQIYNDFLLVKQSYIKMEDNIKKALDNNMQNIKDYEISIKNRIKRLLGEYERCNIRLHIEEDKQNNGWNVFNDNVLIGRITYINNIYDYLISYNDKLYCDACNNYNDCITNITKIIST
jgi:hypothetical protein